MTAQNKLSLTLTLAAGLLWPTLVYSKEGIFSGNQLFEKCDAGRNTAHFTFCLGYMAGVFDALQMQGAVCMPDGVTVGQAVDVVMKHLRDHPEARHSNAASEAGLALVPAFPCNK